MRLLCMLGWHSPGPQILWNAGFWFTKCRDCERDLVRSRHRGWHVPVGAKVVWQAKPPAPHAPAEPVRLIEPPRRVTAIEPMAPADPVPAAAALEPAVETFGPPPLAEPAPPPFAEPAMAETRLVEPQPLAPAERLDLAQFVAEMLNSAGPAVPIQHAVLGDEPAPLTDASQGTESSNGTAVETPSVEDLISQASGAETSLEYSGAAAAEALPEILVADAPPPLELDEPLELVVELDDQLDVPEREAPEAGREAEDAVAEPVDEAELAEGAQPQADATAVDLAVDRAADPAAADGEAPLSPAAAEPAPASVAAAESDPWADFLDDDDDDDADFAWAQESRPEPAVAPRGAAERPAGVGERRGAQRLNEPFRSDIDGRKRWSKNSVKR